MLLRSTLRRLLALVVLSLLGATGALAQATIDPELKGLFSGLPVTGKARVVVAFHGKTGPGAAQMDALKAAGISGGLLFERLPMITTLATWDQVQALSQDPAVRSVFWDRELSLYNEDATHLTGARRVRADEGFRARNLRNGVARYVTGRGVTVLVNDTGIDGLHPDVKFGENVIQNAFSPVGRYQDDLEIDLGFRPLPVIENQPVTDIASGHGTHVAGTVGGTGAASAGKHTGVAPGANLIGYGSGAVVLLTDALGGLDYALAKQDRFNIRVVTNSWGVVGRFHLDDPINIATRQLHAAGIVVVFAAANSGPGPDTHNRYAKAPWVISVAAGQKNGRLASFSSRGTHDGPRTATSSTGETITYLDEPAITAPGVNIISASASTDALGTKVDAFHSMMSGTSMAAPHAAGVIALMLEANPLLAPDQVKQILRETATKMPDAMAGRQYRSFETGAGYVNAYAAVQKSFELAAPFGQTLQVDGAIGEQHEKVIYDRTFAYTPASLPGAYKHNFAVEPGAARVEVQIDFKGYELLHRNLGNPLLLDVRNPNGVRYTAFDVYFAIQQTVKLVIGVNNPIPGTWTAEVKALTPRGNEAGNFATLPDTVRETITLFFFQTPPLADVAGHAGRGAIEWALVNGFLGLCSSNAFCPDQPIRRADLARGFTQFGAIRQFLPLNGGSTFGDVSAADRPFVEAVAARGAALRDARFAYGGVMEGSGTAFNPGGAVNRADMAKMMVRGVGGEAAALAHTGNVTVLYNDTHYVIQDQDQIPEALRGYVHVAINSNMLNVYWQIEQGPYDATPTLKAYFRPTSTMTRADAAVAISRYYPQYFR